ncbi:PadR family transcriptional regulator [Gemmatimonas groenlandica]|uniref:PadR family transcriptional regulator n=1 Tax=Gemmatimonas groenlandica TaxID=2732249 RepID=A0A6M4IL74_9BACT|nr:helix-turn-helix transcriptional regulator [Gemmatimonas groenlandica]QJR34277.1 PadR family transcriptional regulator [Gemmatimonas groenlandica]
MKTHLFFILISLAAEPRYGTAIQDDVRSLSDGSVRLWPATLYGSLEELVRVGWIEEVADDDRPDGGSGRERFYRLTGGGRTALEAESARLDSMVRLARARLTPQGLSV